MSTEILNIENIHTYYGNSHILHGTSLNVPTGKIIALIGRNGVGKTTTLRSIMGLTPPKKGKIYFKGEDITGKQPNVIARKGLGYVPQGRRLFKSLSVLEHLKVFARQNDSTEWDAEKTLDFFPRLKERLHHKGNELSGGEQQMLAVARTLTLNPEILVMDEPTEGLAPLLVKEIGRLIRMIKEKGCTILLTEQKLKFALDLSDEVYIMSKGQIVYHDTSKKLADDRETQYKYLGV